MKDITAVSDDDNDDVQLCRKGDLAAFERLVLRHQKRMLNIAFRMTGSYEDGLEVVQDSFVSAYRNIGGFDCRSKFSTWLCAIVMNAARNRIEQNRSRQSHEGASLDDPIEGTDGPMARDCASDESSALEKLEQKERQEMVRRCIRLLEEDYRAVIVLRDIQGFSYEEIGSALKIAEGTVKSRISRARDSLRSCLRRLFGGDR